MKVIFVCCCEVKMFEVTSRTFQCQAVEGSALQRLPKVGDPESLSQMHEILFQEERQEGQTRLSVRMFPCGIGARSGPSAPTENQML